MKILEPLLFSICIMIVGKICGYSEKLLLDFLASTIKWFVGFEILVNCKIVVRKIGDYIRIAINFFTKN